MLRVSKSRVIEASPERVFAYLVDVGQHAGWFSRSDFGKRKHRQGNPGWVIWGG